MREGARVEWGAGPSPVGRGLQSLFCLQHRGESSVAGRQARRHLLFQAAQRPGVLREVRQGWVVSMDPGGGLGPISALI